MMFVMKISVRKVITKHLQTKKHLTNEEKLKTELTEKDKQEKQKH